MQVGNNHFLVKFTPSWDLTVTGFDFQILAISVQLRTILWKPLIPIHSNRFSRSTHTWRGLWGILQQLWEFPPYSTSVLGITHLFMRTIAGSLDAHLTVLGKMFALNHLETGGNYSNILIFLGFNCSYE